jgi:Metallopeptidase toxin 3
MRFNQFDKPDAAPGTLNIDHTIFFPLCGRYLMNWMNPSILSGKCQPVWKAFVKWCDSEAKAKEACTWGTGPLVEINSRAVGHNMGKYKHGDTVFIHAQVASKYEKGTGWMVWEAVVLHEMMHWARYQQGLPEGPNTGPEEFGHQFEVEAYGKKVTLDMWRAGP